MTLRQLIQSAYQRHGFDERLIHGAPSWAETARFDITAQAPAVPIFDADGTAVQLQSMLRNLLADRFKLKIRVQAGERPIYALVVAKIGPKLGPRLHRSDVVEHVEEPKEG